MIAKGQTHIGVIADTHGRFDRTIIEHFAGVTTILHAGDIGDPEVIRQLERIAPVIAVSGNADEFEKSGFPRSCVIRRAGVTIGIRHILFERGMLTVEARVGWTKNSPTSVYSATVIVRPLSTMAQHCCSIPGQPDRSGSPCREASGC